MMIDWAILFGNTTLLQAVLWITAVVLCVGVVVKLWPFIRNSVAIVDALVALPALAKQVQDIHHEMHPNDGSSLRDSANRTEAAMSELRSDVGELRSNVASVQLRVDELAKADSDIRASITIGRS